MAKYSLEIIPEPKKNSRTVLYTDKKIQYFKGAGNDNYYCGSCEYLLCESITRSQIQMLILKCPECGGYNELKGS